MAALNHAGYTPEVIHMVLVEMAKHRKELEKKTKPILDTLRSYQDLPLDKALVVLAIEDKKRQYTATEKYLKESPFLSDEGQSLFGGDFGQSAPLFSSDYYGRNEETVVLRHSYAEPDLKPFSFLELDHSTEIPRPVRFQQSNGQEPSSYDPEAQLIEDLGVIVTVLSLFSSIRIQIYHVHVQRFRPRITISGIRLLVYLIMDQKGAAFHLALWLIEQVLVRSALKDEGYSSLRHHISLVNHAEMICQIRPIELLPNKTENQMQSTEQAINPFLHIYNDSARHLATRPGQEQINAPSSSVFDL
ncbi:hypothetical protein VNO77_44739 [Canavalia gladiata]|uniref:Uncharacterized protein n=1 Tax=Canavalia gladiata TaxID=3824 RepID=A0AAN9PR03_CANGL